MPIDRAESGGPNSVNEQNGFFHQLTLFAQCEDRSLGVSQVTVSTTQANWPQSQGHRHINAYRW